MKRIEFASGELKKIQVLFFPLNKSHPKATSRAKSFCYHAFSCSTRLQARSQKFAMGGLSQGSGGGAPSARNFAFFLQKLLNFRAI